MTLLAQRLTQQLMTLMEHMQKRGQVDTLVRMLSVAFPKFTPTDEKCVRALSDEALDELTDAVALRRTWREIKSIIEPRSGLKAVSRRPTKRKRLA